MDRFIVVEEGPVVVRDDKYATSIKRYNIMVDKNTGVQYLSTNHNSTAATVLVDKDGKPLLHPRYK